MSLGLARTILTRPYIYQGFKAWVEAVSVSSSGPGMIAWHRNFFQILILGSRKLSVPEPCLNQAYAARAGRIQLKHPLSPKPSKTSRIHPSRGHRVLNRGALGAVG